MNISMLSHQALRNSPAAFMVALFATLMTAPAVAATKPSFPETPLLANRSGVAPNILFILDDSGSMEFTAMPRDKYDSGQRERVWSGYQYVYVDNFTYGLSDNITDRSYLNNTIYYNPAVKYLPWKKSDGTRFTTGTSYTDVWTSPVLLAKDDDRTIWDGNRLVAGMSENLASSMQTYYVPISATGSKTDEANFTRYEIRTDQTIWKCSWVKVGGSSKWQSGSACSQSLPSDRVIQGVVETNTVALELQNFATWFSYHRSRMKVAKAGASEAFGGLGDNYRVGFDTIWNRAEGSRTDGTTTGSKPSHPIPVEINSGAFNGGNRTKWFDFLHKAEAYNGTPLHGALSRAGRYFEGYEKGSARDPWGTGVAGEKPLSCRASYAILTTDGYWNNDNGYPSSKYVGDVDKDTRKDTLADVAMYYYNRDLRGDIANNMTADAQGRRHQRMTTFGISIGLQGTLSGTAPASNSTSWPDPWVDKYLTWNQSTARRIDDLWHAAINTEGAFVVASRTDDFARALQDAFKAIDGRQASGSNLASNGPQVTAGSVKYSAIYHSSKWWGDLRAFPRDVATNSYSETPTWKLSEVAAADAGFIARPVLATGTTGADTFKKIYASDTRFQRDGVTIAANLNYLTGSRAGEDGKVLRQRQVSVIGDIVNSSPVFVNDSGYLFLGANDGMLHGIEAATGRIKFSYVPKGIDIAAMASLSKPDYSHRFFVDGQISVSKIRQKNDKNYLVGALGRGGKGVFALDVTKPDNMTKGQVVWDVSFQTGGHKDMGYVLGNPLARRLKSGKMVALVPNGIDSENESAALFVYDLESSAPVPTVLTVDAGPGNALMVIESADLDADGRTDLVYGGDIKGNVWRWDFRDSDSPAGVRIFTAVGPGGKAQAITGGLTVARDGSRQIFVAFGTGRLITEADLPWVDDQGRQTQSIYGIIDNLASDGTQTIAAVDASKVDRYAELKRRTIPYWGKDSKGRDARAFEYYSALPQSARGWYVDLGVPSPFADGERVVSAPVVAGRALWIDSVWPSEGDGCEAATGNGYMNALDVFTGTNPSMVLGSNNSTGDGTFTFIDVDGDGKGGDRLGGNEDRGENGGYITSVSHGAMEGKPDVSDKEVCTQLDDGRVVCEKRTPVGSASPMRLMWRELFRGG